MKFETEEEILFVFEIVFKFYDVAVSGNLMHFDGVSNFILLTLRFLKLRNNFDGNFQF